MPWAFIEPWSGKTVTGEWPTLTEMFSISVERYGDRACFTDFNPEKHTLTYNEVYANVIKLAKWLVENGVQKLDKVAVTGKNSPEWATVYLAAGFAGATIVPIDYGLREVEIENLLKVSEPKFFFVDEEKYEYFKKNNHFD